MEQIGKYVFIVGVVLAVIAAFWQQPWMWWVLAILGLVVGFLNITGEETRGFLLAAIGLILSASAVRQLPLIGDEITAILDNLVVFISPAVLVVALKSLFEAARD